VTGGLEALSAMLAASAGLWAARRATASSRDEARATLRATIFFGWSTLAGEVLSRLARGEALAPSVPAPDALVTASLSFGAASLLVTRFFAKRRSLGAGSSIALVLAVERLVLDPPPGSSVLASVVPPALRGACVWLGLALARWILEGRHAWVRASLHAVVFGSTLAFILPLAVLRAVGQAPAWPALSPLRAEAALLLATGALALGALAARAFVQAGGTPDPLDPPPRLVTGGIYALLRHPLQIAEAMVLAASSFAFWQPWVVVYAATATLALLGPWRFLEEIMLERRFGDAALRYRRAVPAFLVTAWPRAPRAS
jgi:protein-S-isoprenylcysteine O-methyltransferase Ste14